ncbi:MAG: dicarboxylate/amino acid:cation symporter [Deltaproteobacteria bacterium]|nr:dicarboxylate/amino acid:cation symporter [Deltaproteobacteria bacterium]
MKKLKLHHWILLSMALGAAIGLPLNWAAGQGHVSEGTVRDLAKVGNELGGLFLRLLQMLVVPLIVSSLVTGVTGMGNLKRLGRLGGRTLLYYMVTSLLAILTGMALVNLIQPGVGADLDLLQSGVAESLPKVAAKSDVLEILWDQIVNMIPKNPLRAASEGDMLPIIFFSLLLGVFISVVEHASPHAPDKRNPGLVLREFFASLFDVMMRMTLWVVALAPFGVFGFMLFAAAGHGFAAFEALGLYALTVALGLLIHATVTLPLLVKVLARRSPLELAKAMSPALLTAFSTASSNGTLPLTMQCIEQRAHVPQRVSSFVLPLGATINMDGTALYEAVAVLFIAQVYGMDLGLGQQAIVAITALIASVGAAGIPHAGTVMMVVVLAAVGLPTTAVGLILAVDRILDMCRTAVNVWSDTTAAVVVERYAPEPAEPVTS